MKSWIVTVAVIVASTSALADDKAISAEQAANEAISNRSLARNLWTENIEACEYHDRTKLFAIMGQANGQLQSQPVDHLKYRERFVYSACAQMLRNVLAANGSCLNSEPSLEEKRQLTQQWLDDSAQCNSEIANPDRSLAELPRTQTDTSWEADMRSQGYSDDEIAFMRKLHGL